MRVLGELEEAKEAKEVGYCLRFCEGGRCWKECVRGESVLVEGGEVSYVRRCYSGGRCRRVGIARGTICGRNKDRGGG